MSPGVLANKLVILADEEENGGGMRPGAELIMRAAAAKLREMEKGLREIADFDMERFVMLGPGFTIGVFKNAARKALEEGAPNP